MRKTLLAAVVVLSVLAVPSANAQAQSWCGTWCLATLKEGKWVSDFSLATPGAVAVYSSRAWWVCKNKKQYPAFEHDKVQLRQRWTCKAKTV